MRDIKITKVSYLLLYSATKFPIGGWRKNHQNLDRRGKKEGG